VFDGEQLVFGDDSPYEIGYRRPGLQGEIELDLVPRSVIEIDERSRGLPEVLEEIMTWAHGEDGVERRDAASACGKVEKVRETVLGQSVVGGLGELLGEDGEVGVEPFVDDVGVVVFTEEGEEDDEEDEREEVEFVFERFLEDWAASTNR
jgi:hypothetical protein